MNVRSNLDILNQKGYIFVCCVCVCVHACACGCLRIGLIPEHRTDANNELLNAHNILDISGEV